jgi:hypothetical protein
LSKFLPLLSILIKFCNFLLSQFFRAATRSVGAVASLEADLDALRRDVASLRPRQQASRPTWPLFAAAAGLALAAWILTPPVDPYAVALTS